MPNLNKVMLMGNLTRDPELRYLPSNMPVVSLGLAINRRWRNAQGEQQEETTFVDCESFGKQAELINQYMRKGRPIFIEGRLKLDQWKDQSGNNRQKMKVVVESFQFVDSRADGEGGAPAGSRGPSQSRSASSAGERASYDDADHGPHQSVDDDDIPF
jgi:single-strand DNA-binding protein